MSGTCALPEELNIYAVGAAWQEIRAAVSATPDRLVTIDCAAVREIDAAGAQLLLAVAKAGRSGSAAITLSPLPAVIFDKLAPFGFAGALAQCDGTREQAT